MKEKLEQIRLNAVEALKNARQAKDIDDLKVRFLGKKGELTAILKEMNLPEDAAAQDRNAQIGGHRA